MGTFSRLRYVVAANVNALLEKAEDPEKLLRALIREMEDASEEARLASADLLAEQQRLARLESDLEAESGQWRDRAENAVVQDRDDLARVALKARAEVDARHKAVVEEQSRLAERITQMEQDMLTLKSKLAEAKARLKSMHMEAPNGGKAATVEHSTPGERKMRRAMQRFDRLQAQVDNLEARVRSYEVGGAAPAVWQDQPAEQADPAIEAELQRLKQRLAAGEQRPAESEEA
jgi:phage shock protein A